MCRNNERNFSQRRLAGLVGEPIFLPVCWWSCTQVRKHQRKVDSSYFIIERGVFCGVYIRKRGYVFWGHNRKNAHKQQRITRTYRPNVHTVYIIILFTERLRKYMTGHQVMLQMKFLVIHILYISIMRLAMMTDFVWFIVTRNEQVFLYFMFHSVEKYLSWKVSYN